MDSRTDAVLVYDTQSWTQVGSIALASGVIFQPNGSTIGFMSASNDGKLLFVTTGPQFAAAGFEAIDLTARSHLTVQGDATHTLLYGSVGADTITGSAANDLIDGGGGDDVLDGGGGVNTVSYASATTGVTVSLALQGSAQNTLGAGSDTLTNFQNLAGSAFADTLTGDANNNVIDGGAGGNDVLDGGAGVNTVSFASATAGVTVSLALQGSAQNAGGAGTDTLSNFQNLTGSAFNDTLEGDANNNAIDGGGGNDVLDGGGGVNTISYAAATAGVTVNLGLQGVAQNTGGGAVDTLTHFQNLTGSAFNDTLMGDSGRNVLTGGGGADTLVFIPTSGSDTITDFSETQGDRIDISAFGLTSLVQISLTQINSDTLVTLLAQPASGASAVSLLLENVVLSSPSSQDFILTPGPTAYFATARIGVAGVENMLVGGSGNDFLQGQALNDTLQGGGGHNVLDGGAGLNTALYKGLYRGYTVSATTTGLNGVAGGVEGGTDSLTNIQRIQFADGYVATSPNDTAGEVYRLYEATLGRAPDPVGLANWVHQLNSGSTTLQAVVNGFVGSAEFQALYGTLDNTGFVTLLYNNVLHRAPDAGGLAGWINLLNTGHTRAEVVLGFSESQEDIGALAAPVQQGLWIEDPGAAQVARLYDTVLGRMPDQGGEASWTQILDSGAQTL